MEVTYKYIRENPDKFKICNICGKINWHENELCYNCYSEDFSEPGEGVEDFIIDEYAFYMSDYGMGIGKIDKKTIYVGGDDIYEDI